MKNLFKLFSFLSFVTLFSCNNNTLPFTPKIHTAYYSYKSIGEFERGYQLMLHIERIPDKAKLKGVIINQKLFNYSGNTTVNNGFLKLNEYFPISSKTIVNLIPPSTDTRKNGIIFEFDKKTYFYPINFNNK